MTMAVKMNEKRRNFRLGVFQVFILILTGIISFFILILPDSFSQSSFPMELGDAAVQDILAPYSLNFESEVLTEQARQSAEESVNPIYLPADPSIGRRQVEQLRTVLYYMTTVRQDDFATQDEKINDIQAIESIELSDEIIQQILQVNDNRWEAIESEATAVLETIMRNTLRESDIFSARRNIPSLIDFSFSEEQAEIVTHLVEPYIVPNSLYSEEQTEAAFAEARQSVDPIIRSFITGETLVRRGQIIRDVEWEAMQRYGLIQPSDRTKDIVGAAVLTIVICFLVGKYFQKKENN